MSLRINEQKVLAFDVRVPPSRANLDLPSGYRKHALLVPTVVAALSVDETVWAQIERERFEAFVQRAAAAMKPSCDARSLLDSNDLVSRLPDQWLSDRPDVLAADDWLIALSISANVADELSSLRPKGLLFNPTVDAGSLQRRNWRLLGFDVADKALYSPLTNADLGESARDSVARPFRDQVNEYGLFTAVDVAERFAKVAADYVADHAPYYAFAILGHPSNR